MGKKKAIDSHNPKGYWNERKLFHGCPEDVTEKVSYRGFNRSFAGKNGITYVYALIYALVFASGFWENMPISHIQFAHFIKSDMVSIKIWNLQE